MRKKIDEGANALLYHCWIFQFAPMYCLHVMCVMNKKPVLIRSLHHFFEKEVAFPNISLEYFFTFDRPTPVLAAFISKPCDDIEIFMLSHVAPLFVGSDFYIALGEILCYDEFLL